MSTLLLVGRSSSPFLFPQIQRPLLAQRIAWSRAGWIGWRHRLLELFRRTIAERRLESHPVIVLFDEDLDVPAQMPEISIPVRVDLFSLQRLQKTLAARVVVRVRRPTHARNHLVLVKELYILPRGV